MTSETLHGVWAALLTPWTADDRVDEAAVEAEIHAFAAAGVHGLYTGGTAGEFYAQDDATFVGLTRLVCRTAANAGLPVQIGCTALSTRTVRARIAVARDCGADGVQLALPFWVSLDDRETLDFFAEVADAAGPVPLVLYQTPRAKRRIDPPLLGRLAEQAPTLIGIKDTAADTATFTEIRDSAPRLSVFGADCHLVERMKSGGRGTYSSLAGLNPRLMVEYYEDCRRGRWEDAGQVERSLQRLMGDVLRPIMREAGLADSAIDRVQRAAGGGTCGLRCARPYRSGRREHVERVIAWCRTNAPDLLPK